MDGLRVFRHSRGLTIIQRFKEVLRGQRFSEGQRALQGSDNSPRVRGRSDDSLKIRGQSKDAGTLKDPKTF